MLARSFDCQLCSPDPDRLSTYTTPPHPYNTSNRQPWTGTGQRTYTCISVPDASNVTLDFVIDSGCFEIKNINHSVDVTVPAVVAIKAELEQDDEVCSGSTNGVLKFKVSGDGIDLTDEQAGAVTGKIGLNNCTRDSVSAGVALFSCSGLGAAEHTFVAELARVSCEPATAELKQTVDTIPVATVSAVAVTSPAAVCEGTAPPNVTFPVTSNASSIELRGSAYDGCTVSSTATGFEVTCVPPSFMAYNFSVVGVYGGDDRCETAAQDVLFEVKSMACDAAACVTRGPGYWMTHGDEVKRVMGTRDIELWGVTFSADKVSGPEPTPARRRLMAAKPAAKKAARAAKAPKALPPHYRECATGPGNADALRALCSTGTVSYGTVKNCKLGSLGRQCMAARINMLLTASCGNAGACERSSAWARVLECCGAKAAPQDVAGCMADVESFNQEKNDAKAGYCPQMPLGGPATTMNACQAYGSEFNTKSTTATSTCARGFCAAPTPFNRRLMF